MSLPEPSGWFGPGGRRVCRAELGSGSFCDMTFPGAPFGGRGAGWRRYLGVGFRQPFSQESVATVWPHSGLLAHCSSVNMMCFGN